MGVHYGKSDFITYGKPSLFLDFANKKSLVDRISGNDLITFTRSSSATYVGSDGLIKTASTNEPRFDHNPATGESLGLLVEESRYNIASYSEDFSNSYWASPTASSGGTFSIISNSIKSPDGAITADKLVMQSGVTSVNYQYWYIKNSGYNPNGSDRWIWSFYVKSAGSPIVTLGGQHGGDRQWSFNLSTGSPVSNYGTTGDSYQYIGDGWYRLSLGWIPTLGAYGSPGVNFGCSGITGDGNVGIYMWGAQLEKGEFLTSYIPTPSTTVVTKNADSSIITGTNFSSWYNQNEGTFILNSKLLPGSGSQYGVAGETFINGSSSPNGLSIMPNYLNGGLAKIEIPLAGDYTGRGISSNSLNYSNQVKMAAAIQNNNVGLSVNGVSYNSITNKTIAQDVTAMRIGASRVASNILDGTISRLVYYPKRLTDTQLQQLTS
jgi:hypothetical protein